ncbi:MAG: sulfite exporter TauE/SafE family protein [Crocinitomicaceae bacterium]
MVFPIEYLGLLIGIPVIAFLYASVGHGGASGYIALLFLFSFPTINIKPIALTINLFVAAIAFYHFWKQGHFKWNLFVFFAIGSIPFSFIGGLIEVQPLLYHTILAGFILFSIIKLVGLISSHHSGIIQKINPYLAVGVGAAIGIISGLIGIGGGIILTPVLLILNWASIKQAAAVSALFIWVNSAAGLYGQIQQNIELPSITWTLVLLALFGGFLGSYIGASKISDRWVKAFLIAVLLIAFAKLVNTIWIII